MIHELKCERCASTARSVGDRWSEHRLHLFPDWAEGRRWKVCIAELRGFGPRIYVDLLRRTVYLRTRTTFHDVELIHAMCHAATLSADHGERWAARMRGAAASLSRLGHVTLARQVSQDALSQGGTPGCGDSVDRSEEVLVVVGGVRDRGVSVRD